MTFDPQSRTLVLNKDTDATRYAVVSAKGSIVTGKVGHRSGLDFVADFGTDEQMRLYSAGSLIQTDDCRPPLDTGL